MAMSREERAERKRLRAESDARMAAAKAEAVRVVAGGVCPQCGAPLRRNLSLTGWWQCGAFGEVQFRSPGCEERPKCSFQCFTD